MNIIFLSLLFFDISDTPTQDLIWFYFMFQINN